MRFLSICACAVWSLLPALSSLGPTEAAPPQRYRIAFATYLGGKQAEQGREIIVCPDGSILIGGQTNSSDFPTTPGAFQEVYAGDDPSLGHPGVFGGDCYLVRLSGDGKQLLSATYFGGSKQERNVYGMALDRAGNVVITSSTRSPDLPTTGGCFQPKYGGPSSDWFAAKLTPDLGTLLWCTYIGGAAGETPRGGLTLDGDDHVYLVGSTESQDFPTTAGALQRIARGRSDAAIAKLMPDGSGLAWSTRLGGGEGDGILGVRVNPLGDVVVGGHTRSADFPTTDGAAQQTTGGQSDCFVARLSSAGDRLLYSTRLGGRSNEFAEHSLHLFPDGSPLLTGWTESADFPTTDGAFQRVVRGTGCGFVTSLAADGTGLVFSTLLGGSGSEFCLTPTPDAEGNIFVVGQTSSKDFPVTQDALQSQYGGGKNDGVLAVLTPDGSGLVYATYLGGSGDDIVRGIAFGADDEIYLVGTTTSANFPVSEGAFQTAREGRHDAFVVKLVRRNPA